MHFVVIVKQNFRQPAWEVSCDKGVSDRLYVYMHVCVYIASKSIISISSVSEIAIVQGRSPFCQSL